MFEVRFEFVRYDFESGRFIDIVGIDEIENLVGMGSGELVEFKSVGGVLVGYVGFKVGGKVKNLNGVEGIFVMVLVDCWIVIYLFFDIDIIIYVEFFRDECFFVIWIDFDIEFVYFDYGIWLFVFLMVVWY